MKQRLIWIVLPFALMSLTATTGNAEVIGRTFYLVGDATIWRAGSPIPFVQGMDILDGDGIETERLSVAGILLYDELGEVATEMKMFGMPAITGGDAGGGGGSGCAGAPGNQGKTKLQIYLENYRRPNNPLPIVIDLTRGNVKVKSRKLSDKKDYRVKSPSWVSGVRDTEFTLLHDAETGLGELTVHEGTVIADNIDYLALPDEYFTDPGNKGSDTLDLNAVIDDTDLSTSIVDLLGAGNAVDVNAGYYSTCALGSAPAAPSPGIAPTHALPGGECPEPATLCLLGLGGLALLR